MPKHPALCGCRWTMREGAYRPLIYGRIALWEGDFASAQPLFAEGVRTCKAPATTRREISALIGLAEAELGLGHAPAALVATSTATKIHRQRDLAAMDGFDPVQLWWLHHPGAGGQRSPRRGAAGARRSPTVSWSASKTTSPTKDFETISRQGRRQPAGSSWPGSRTRARARRAYPSACRTSQGKSSLREPFERLVDTGCGSTSCAARPNCTSS